MGEHPSLIGSLVGIAVASIAIDPLDAMLEQPDCPNLYWALTNLPDPLVSIRAGMDGERMMCSIFFAELDRAAPMSAEQLKKFIDPIDMLFNDGNPLPIREYLAARTKDEQKMAAARKRLVDSGVPQVRLQAYPPEQVILLTVAAWDSNCPQHIPQRFEAAAVAAALAERDQRIAALEIELKTLRATKAAAPSLLA